MNHPAVQNASSWARRCPPVPGFAKTIFVDRHATASNVSGYPTTDQNKLRYIEGVGNRVTLARQLLCTLTPEARCDDTLVVGAGDGCECLWLSRLDGGRVTGLDRKGDGGAIEQRLLDDFGQLQSMPEAGPEAIELISDDICACSLADASFDRVLSWQTFEHIMDPAAALREIHRVLRPGGVAFIEYNPFFSIDGAHWVGTIDIPWAHARLADDEFEDAVTTLHPGRPAYAGRLVRKGINRMSHAQCRDFAHEAGFEVVEFLPRVRTEDALVLDDRILSQVLARYPQARPIDLLCRIVRVVLRKGDKGQSGLL
ncbi:MAG: methyltransferase domain-containing protein [Phycisphaerales bacterium JB052]